MDEFMRATTVAIAVIVVVVGTVGWVALGWAWGTGNRGTAVRFGSSLAGSCAIALMLASWTSTLTGAEALIGVGVWLAAYLGVAAGTRVARS